MKNRFYYNQIDVFDLSKYNNDDDLLLLESDLLNVSYILRPFYNIDLDEKGVDIYYINKSKKMKHFTFIIIDDAYNIKDLVADDFNNFLDWDEVNERINIIQVIIEHILEIENN